MNARARAGQLLKSIWHGILGIAAETVVILLFIAAGLAVCFLWWSFFR